MICKNIFTCETAIAKETVFNIRYKLVQLGDFNTNQTVKVQLHFRLTLKRAALADVLIMIAQRT